ncbi:MAG: DUF5615 family PIN-like protein [Acidobacteria bacterium]|nr:DUF5615 family PIN-like protein [Acidobacteriota bacterium]
MARFLADENFPFPVTEAFRRLGHDVVTLADIGKAGRALTDQAVLDLATADARCVLTLNRRDFARLHRASSDHAGIVVCTFDTDFEGQAGRIHAAITAYVSLTGELIRVGRG